MALVCGALLARGAAPDWAGLPPMPESKLAEAS